MQKIDFLLLIVQGMVFRESILVKDLKVFEPDKILNVWYLYALEVLDHVKKQSIANNGMGNK